MPDPLLVPLRTVCRMLGISETTYFRFRRCGADVPVPVASPHRRLLFAAEDIEACVERWKRASRLHVVQRRREERSRPVKDFDRGAA